MKDTKVNSLGFELLASVPETVTEYDTLAKKEGACLESGVNNVLYRSVFAKFRSKFADAVENNSGIARETEVTLDSEGSPKKDDEGNEVTRYTQTEKKYFDAVCAQLVKQGEFASLEAAAASFFDLAQTIMTSIVFDPSETERESAGPKKVAKQYLEVAATAEKNGNLDRLADTLREKLGNWKVEASVESVARAISEDQRRKRESVKLTEEYGA